MLAENKTTNPKALIVVTNHGEIGERGENTGWHLSEVSHVYYPLVEAGYDVDIASPRGGNAPIDPSSVDLEDEINKKFLTSEKVKAKIQDTLKIGDLDGRDYHIVHFAGGHGTMWDFDSSKGIQKFTAQLYENGGIVAAVCHGPAALLNVELANGKYLIDGKEINSFTNNEEREMHLDEDVPFLLETELKERGARFIPGDNFTEMVVVSERLVTGQNPQSVDKLARKILEIS